MAVSLNIALQKAPVSNDQGFFIFFNQFEIGGLSSIRIMLAVRCSSRQSDYFIFVIYINQFHSQVFPLSSEKAWLQIGLSLSLASQRKATKIFFPLNVSFVMKCPTLFSNDPNTGGSN